MSITSEEAAVIAHKHNLSLADAVAIRQIANTTAEAEAIAAMFSPTAAADAGAAKMNANIRQRVADKTARRRTL